MTRQLYQNAWSVGASFRGPILITFRGVPTCRGHIDRAKPIAQTYTARLRLAHQQRPEKHYFDAAHLPRILLALPVGCSITQYRTLDDQAGAYLKNVSVDGTASSKGPSLQPISDFDTRGGLRVALAFTSADCRLVPMPHRKISLPILAICRSIIHSCRTFSVASRTAATCAMANLGRDDTTLLPQINMNKGSSRGEPETNPVNAAAYRSIETAVAIGAVITTA